MGFSNSRLNLKGRSINPFVGFLPFLLLYLCIVLFSSEKQLEGDEGRYLWFAENLLKGYYSPEGAEFNLWNGPGYPLFLVPFVFFGASKLLIALFNALFLYLSLPLIYASLTKYTSGKSALLGAIAFGLWVPGYDLLGMIMTEYLTVFLISLTVYFLTHIQNKYHTYYLGLVLGYLVLIKVIMAYVLLLSLIIALVTIALRKTEHLRSYALAIILAFLVTAPYQYYTKQLTGKYFYWANSGGMSLYWMSAVDNQEFGDWNSIHLDAYCWEGSPLCNTSYFEKNHGTFFENMRTLPPTERDAAYKNAAIENIKAEPFKFVQNVYANLSRMFFNYPESYMFPRLTNIIRLFPGSILFTFMLVTIGVGFRYLRKLPIELIAVLLFSLIYLGGSALLSAYPRILYVMLPAIFTFGTYILDRFFQVRIAHS